MVLMMVFEIFSMVFFMGLVQFFKFDFNKGVMLVIVEVEICYEVWVLLDIWKVDLFGGLFDIIFFFVGEILDFINVFIVFGSCLYENLEFFYN